MAERWPDLWSANPRISQPIPCQADAVVAYSPPRRGKVGLHTRRSPNPLLAHPYLDSTVSSRLYKTKRVVARSRESTFARLTSARCNIPEAESITLDSPRVCLLPNLRCTSTTISVFKPESHTRVWCNRPRWRKCNTPRRRLHTMIHPISSNRKE